MTMNNYNSNNHKLDYGPAPFIVNIDSVTNQNTDYRRTLWTGNHLQLTLMSINVGGDIGIERHTDLDQFVRVEDGLALVRMGPTPNRLFNEKRIDSNYAVVIPAGAWHNIINIGNRPLKLYSLYAPPTHERGTIHVTKEDSQK